MVERGKLIVLEGGSRSGKTTQALKFHEEYSGWKCYREPGGTPFGERIRDAVQGIYDYEVHPYAALFAYTAARVNLVRSVIIPDLKDGFDVLLDRYWFSTYAYQGARGVSKPLICVLSVIATKGLMPNAVLHYDLLPELGAERKVGLDDVDGYDALDIEFQHRVRANYRQLKHLFPRKWKVIDASQTEMEVFEASLAALRDLKII